MRDHFRLIMALKSSFICPFRVLFVLLRYVPCFVVPLPPHADGLHPLKDL